MKKILLLTLVFMLTFSSAAFGMTGANSAQKNVNNLLTLTGEKPALNLPERLVNPENPDEKVRIIVELEKAPTIQRATEKGVLYKQLPSTERESLETAIVADQVDVQKEINKEAPSIEYLESFTSVFNGFSAEVEAQYVESIANTEGVKAVYEATEYERPSVKPEMIYSKELVQAQKAWKDYGFKGEGMVVGIIDTGIDPNHKDMVLTDNSTGDITKEEVDKLLADKKIDNGKYFTAKVPFGWNYMDKNDQILDIGPDASMHGMHVGGTVAANGDDENGGIQGVAPEAQLLALKVFGNDPLFPSTFGDIYIKAIDDSIKLGADVINMSLGSTAGFVDANNPEQQAVKRATENGVLVAISAGNSALFGDGSFYPYAENQDYGLTGSPSVSEKSLGVAAFENSTLTAYGFTYHVDGEAAGDVIYLLANDADPVKFLKEPYEVVDAGFGNKADFEGKDFKGKVALISRGSIAFTEKGLNAQAAGAAGVIIYNNTAGTINMASDPAIKIPYMSIMQTDGQNMLAAIKAEKQVTVSFEGKFVNTPNPLAGSMSDFTSWGPTPNLDFKPEITAPGGNIFSTLNDNKYGVMSGTSMAAPHVAGGAALIFERVDKEFKVTGSDRVTLAKNLLMNTAKPVVFDPENGDYVSPRRQGAGLMQLANALSTDVVVTNKATGEAKVALKEIKDNQITFTLEAKNYSTKEVSYNVDVAVQVDYAAKVSGVVVTAPNHIGSQVVTEDVDIDTLESITVPANGTATLDVSIDITSLDELKEIFTNGFFVDGFVTLTDANEEVTGNVPLTVPFFGFNGGWDDAPLFDYFAWDNMTYWGYTALADEQGYFIDGGGDFDTTRFGFSPNGDGLRDKAVPVFSLFRNAKSFKVEVVDAEGNVLRTIRTANNLRKNYISSTTTAPYTYSTNYAWDGKINGILAEDGQYFIKLSGVIDFEGAEWQSIQFPVKVDTTAPTAEVEFTEETKTLAVASIADNEEGTGAEYWEVLINGESESDALALDAEEYVVTNELSNKDSVVVRVWDAAGNYTDYPFSVQSEPEEQHPVIYIETPDFFGAYDSNEVEVVGSVDDASKIKSVTVNGEEAQNFDGVDFSHTLTLEDGVQDVTVGAVDEFDTEMSITRKVFVDTQVPTIEVKNDYPNVTMENTVKVKVTLKDNFDDIRVNVNGDERFYNELSEPYAMSGFEKEIEVELKLSEGDNEFVIEVEDLVGHKASQTVKIKKAEKPVETPDPGTPGPAPGPTTPAPPAGTVVVTDGDVSGQINDANAKSVEVKVAAPTEAQPVSAQVSASILKAVADSSKPFAVKAGDTVVSVPANVLKAIAKDSPASATFNVALVKDAKVPGKGTTASAVYDFSISVSKDGKTTNVSTFSEPVSVTIPTTATVKDARKVAAYYLNGDKLEYVGGKYANGKVEFNTNHFSKFVVVENNKTFADVKNSFAQDAIEVLASRSITSGKSDTKFDPNGQITRAEFAVLIARALNLPTEDYKGTFKDVPKSKAWAYAGVEAAYRAGIVKGKSADTFAPDALITREEIAVMVVRAVEYQDANVLKDLDTSKKFADDASIGTFAKDGVKKASALGIVSGRGGKFDPKANATRAESAVMLYRALNKLVEF